MLTISAPLSAGQAIEYHKTALAEAKENYYARGADVAGWWAGKLAGDMGLVGPVEAEHFARLARGEHPFWNHDDTGAPVQLIRLGQAVSYRDANGKMVTTMGHRAGHDATFSAPKSVSIMATVGGDYEVRLAHRAAVDVALRELEAYTQARMGGSRAPETTGKFVAAVFEHDSARPVGGYAAPAIHSHCVIANLTQVGGSAGTAGKWRSIQSKSWLESQQFATSVYRGELAIRLRALGYEVERGQYGQPEINGLSHDYLEASSPRRAQILAALEAKGMHGAAAAQIAAHETRDRKGNLSKDEILAHHQALADEHGNQAETVLAEALANRRAMARTVVPDANAAKEAVTYATARGLERSAVVAEREILSDALRLGMGYATIGPIREEWQRRIDAGQFLERDPFPHKVGRAFTSPEMVSLEQQMIDRLLAAQARPVGPMAKEATIVHVERHHLRLTDDQRAAFRQLMTVPDQVLALDGKAGVGKTTTLAAVRDAAERDGYQVTGVAPTGQAAKELRAAGMATMTLQRYLAQTPRAEDIKPRLYVLDESSLTSTVQMQAFLELVRQQDRVLLVGDIAQHQSVDAGRPFQQLQEHGLTTVHLTAIIRQTDPALRQDVEHLSAGRTREALKSLDARGHIHEIASGPARYRFIADEFVKDPDGTRVVNPDNASRMAINTAVHQALQAKGIVEKVETPTRVLVDRSEMTTVDRQHADRYAVGETLRYNRGSKAMGIRAGDYATVTATDRATNMLTVTRADGSSLKYDVARLHGCTVYAAQERNFAPGDRVLFTEPNRTLGVLRRDTGVIEDLALGDARITLDSGKTVDYCVASHPHLDFSYASTSISAQGMTVRKVILHIDNSRGGDQIGQRLGYVGISRARDDAIIVTDNKARLFEKLPQDHGHRVALEPRRVRVHEHVVV